MPLSDSAPNERVINDVLNSLEVKPDVEASDIQLKEVTGGKDMLLYRSIYPDDDPNVPSPKWMAWIGDYDFLNKHSRVSFAWDKRGAVEFLFWPKFGGYKS